jgi:hypothetical protein
VADLAAGARLALEPVADVGVGDERRVEDLDGGEPAQGDVGGLVDQAHAAAADRGIEAIAAVDRVAEHQAAVVILERDGRQRLIGDIDHRLLEIVPRREVADPPVSV